MADQRVDQFNTAALPLAASTIIPVVPPTTASGQSTPPMAMQTPLSSILIDSGWQPLLGFGFLPASGFPVPSFRVVGRQIFFKGTVIIPLGTGGVTSGAPVNYISEATYAALATVAPSYSGAGSVVVDGSGKDSLIFNQGNSVLPSSVTINGASYPIVLDGNYQLGNAAFGVSGVTIARRVLSAASGTPPVTYTGVGSVTITSAGLLIYDSFRDGEDGGGVLPVAAVGGSPLRFISSKVALNSYVLDFTAIASGSLTSSASATAQTYTIPVVSPNVQHPVTLDAMDVSTIGGFSFSLNGLTAFLAPLT